VPEHTTTVTPAHPHTTVTPHDKPAVVHVQPHETPEIIHTTTVVYKSNKKAQLEINEENDKINSLREKELKETEANKALELKITANEKHES